MIRESDIPKHVTIADVISRVWWSRSNVMATITSQVKYDVAQDAGYLDTWKSSGETW